MTFIGGHRAHPSYGDGPGVHVYRLDDGVVEKQAYTKADVEGLRNEDRLLRLLEDEDVAPRSLFLSEGKPNVIWQEDLGINQLVHDGELFRRNGVRLLWKLRQHHIRHGDLTGVNLIIRDDKVYAIDFQQSHLFEEEITDKRKLSDSYYLWRALASSPSKMHPTPDTPRVMRRWLGVMGELGGLSPRNPLVGKTLLDLGCFQGDFCAMAAADGMYATGVDAGGFQSGEDSIATAQDLWEYMGEACLFIKRDILDPQYFRYDVVLLFSTWAYIYNDYGQERAYDLLDRIVRDCGVFFFETQLHGDGPGPDHLLEDDDVANMLGQFGTVKPVVTIPVTGRPASRTVWKVTK